MGMIERKKSILLNEPHLATASGSVATFDTDMRSRLKECKIFFKSVQSGSGTPSPSNVRPISGRTGISINNNGDTISVSWQSEAGTLYGGYVDLISGEIVATTILKTYYGNGNEHWSYDSNNKIGGIAYGWFPNNEKPKKGQYKGEIEMFSNMGVQANRSTGAIQGTVTIVWAGGLAAALGAQIGVTDISGWMSWLSNNPLQVAYQLETPIAYQLTPQQIKTIIGRNNIWSDAGDVEVQYWKH